MGYGKKQVGRASHSLRRVALAIASCLVVYGAVAQPQRPVAQENVGQYIIPAGDLVDALEKFSTQSGVQVVYRPELATGKRAPALKGAMTPAVALQRLLKGSGLRWERANAQTYVLKPALVSPLEVPVKPKSRITPAAESEVTTLPEILVKGSRSQNVDIARTEDDAQPYVIFERGEIERSQAVNLEQFLKTRLPMNTNAVDAAQTGVSNYSRINLRGLGADETLILVDGRRLPWVPNAGENQPDINGIALSAVERIEVLPSSAAGIYGGGATGGVINIILRRDFDGAEAKLTYGNTFKTDVPNVRAELLGGLSLNGGRTRLSAMVSVSDSEVMHEGDRDFSARARRLLYANDPSQLTQGNPPIGATVNIRAIDGNLTLDPRFGNAGVPIPLTYDGLPTNTTHLSLGYPGPDSDNGADFLRNAGQYNLDLPNDASGLQRGLVSAPSQRSLTASLRHEFNSRLEGFLDLSWLGNRSKTLRPGIHGFAILPADAPNNPFQQDIAVTFPSPGLGAWERSDITTVRALGGLIARLPYDWSAGVDYAWSRTRNEYESSAINASRIDSAGLASLGTGQPALDGRPPLDVLQEGNTFPLDISPYLLPSSSAIRRFESVQKDIALRLSGPTLQLPAGPITLSALIEHSESEFADAVTREVDPSSSPPNYAFRYTFYPGTSQKRDSYYAEARVPLVSQKNARRWAQELEMQLSFRRDDYESVTFADFADFQHDVPSRNGPFPAVDRVTLQAPASTKRTLALRYAPVADLALRASYATGFLPPAPGLQTSPFVITNVPVNCAADPRRGGQFDPIACFFNPGEIVAIGNPDLRPEDSVSWSAGLIFTPRTHPSLRVSLDYTRIDKVDEISTPGLDLLLQFEDQFPGRIVRASATPEDIARGWAGLITRYNISNMNIAKTKVEAYDLQADYDLQTRFGHFHWYGVVTRQTRYLTQVLPTSAPIDSVGFLEGPQRWRGNMGMSWERGSLTVGWNAQYYDSYLVYPATLGSVDQDAVSRQGSATIPSQTYHDLFISYRFDDPKGWLKGWQVELGIQNVFDKSPPIVVDSIGGGYSTFGDPRMRRYALTLRRRFGDQ